MLAAHCKAGRTMFEKKIGKHIDELTEEVEAVRDGEEYAHEHID